GRAAIQRVCRSDENRSLRHQRQAAGAAHYRGLSAEEILSRPGERLAVVLHGDHGQGVDRRGGEGGGAVNKKIRKATTHISQNEVLLFERSSAGKKAYQLPPLDVPEVDPAKLLGTQAREDLGHMPEVSEIEIIRHFTRLSTWNY